MLAGATDWLDGYLARALGTRSRASASCSTRPPTGSTSSRRCSASPCATSCRGGWSRCSSRGTCCSRPACRCCAGTGYGAAAGALPRQGGHVLPALRLPAAAARRRRRALGSRGAVDRLGVRVVGDRAVLVVGAALRRSSCATIVARGPGDDHAGRRGAPTGSRRLDVAARRDRRRRRSNPATNRAARATRRGAAPPSAAAAVALVARCTSGSTVVLARRRASSLALAVADARGDAPEAATDRAELAAGSRTRTAATDELTAQVQALRREVAAAATANSRTTRERPRAGPQNCRARTRRPARWPSRARASGSRSRTPRPRGRPATARPRPGPGPRPAARRQRPLGGRRRGGRGQRPAADRALGDPHGRARRSSSTSARIAPPYVVDAVGDPRHVQAGSSTVPAGRALQHPRAATYGIRFEHRVGRRRCGCRPRRRCGDATGPTKGGSPVIAAARAARRHRRSASCCSPTCRSGSSPTCRSPSSPRWTRCSAALRAHARRHLRRPRVRRSRSSRTSWSPR